MIEWLKTELNCSELSLIPLVSDAGFRQYFRFKYLDKTLIAVIAPPATENNDAFIKISQAFSDLGLAVPKVLAYDLQQGFLLLTDLGDAVLQFTITEQTADHMYSLAFKSLAKIQQSDLTVPIFGEAQMRQELQNFEQWFLLTHLNYSLSGVEQKLLANTFNLLLQSAIQQPQCVIHRDYHSRNLMVLPDQKIGILDFQDAMHGPITYDLVSLIRDCYIAWPSDQVTKWFDHFYQNHWQSLMPDYSQMRRWFDLMGIQRHLKAIFIFARKFERDHNSRYLADIPRTMKYIIEVSDAYPELLNFKTWLAEIIYPKFMAKL